MRALHRRLRITPAQNLVGGRFPDGQLSGLEFLGLGANLHGGSADRDTH